MKGINLSYDEKNLEMDEAIDIYKRHLETGKNTSIVRFKGKVFYAVTQTSYNRDVSSTMTSITVQDSVIIDMDTVNKA